MTTPDALLTALARIANALERAQPPAPPAADWQHGRAFRWRQGAHGGYLETVTDLSPIQLTDLCNIDRQKAELVRNTEQFVTGRPANNVLLTGSRGTGKSSLVKALVNAYGHDGLRVVEVDRDLLIDLPDIIALLRDRGERFIIYCDDLSFSEDDASYRALKVTLDGSLHAGADNVIIYATSNRRHLLPEYHHENLMAHAASNGEIHPGEAVEDKISLSDRFGLWLSFQPNSQDEYLATVRHWLGHFQLELDEGARRAALQWAQGRGNRSSRTAAQFARDWAGRRA